MHADFDARWLLEHGSLFVLMILQNICCVLQFRLAPHCFLCSSGSGRALRVVVGTRTARPGPFVRQTLRANSRPEPSVCVGGACTRISCVCCLLCSLYFLQNGWSLCMNGCNVMSGCHRAAATSFGENHRTEIGISILRRRSTAAKSKASSADCIWTCEGLFAICLC